MDTERENGSRPDDGRDGNVALVLLALVHQLALAALAVGTLGCLLLTHSCGPPLAVGRAPEGR